MKKFSTLFALVLFGAALYGGLFASSVTTSSGDEQSPGLSSDDEATVKKGESEIKVDVLMNVVKQDAGMNNCSAFALTNAVRFFQALPFTVDVNYQAILSSIKTKVNAPIDVVGLRKIANNVDLLKGKPFVVLAKQSFDLRNNPDTSAFAEEIDDDNDFQSNLVTLNSLANQFKQDVQPAVGILMQLDAGNYAHWVFIGITKTANGINVVIPETAQNDYVSEHLPFLKKQIFSNFE